MRFGIFDARQPVSSGYVLEVPAGWLALLICLVLDRVRPDTLWDYEAVIRCNFWEP